MKKKGLIISTVVMAVVLIAALTTATYAWFSASATAAVEDIALNVQAASNVSIGLLSTGSQQAAADYKKGDPTQYNNGAVTYTGSTGLWGNGEPGLGASVDTKLAMKVTAGVSSGLAGQSTYAKLSATDLASGYLNKDKNGWSGTAFENLYTFNSKSGTYTKLNSGSTYSGSVNYYKSTGSGARMDYVYNSGNPLFKANGTSYDTLDAPTRAYVNGYNGSAASTDSTTDAFDLKMAIDVTKANQYGTYCVITIDPTTSYLGMAAALHFEIKIGSRVYDADIFGTDDTIKYNTPVAEGNVYKFWFFIDTPGTDPLEVKSTDCTEFSIRFFVNGANSDCCGNATGKGATISLQFDSCDSASYNGANLGTDRVTKLNF